MEQIFILKMDWGLKLAVAKTHIAIDVENLDEAEQFFQDVFLIAPYLYDNESRQFTILFGSIDISVFERPEISFNLIQHGPSFHIGLKAESLKELNSLFENAITNSKCKKNTGIFDRIDGDKSFFFYGIGNIRFEVFFGEHILAKANHYDRKT